MMGSIMDFYIICTAHRAFRYLNKESSEHWRENMVRHLTTHPGCPALYLSDSAFVAGWCDDDDRPRDLRDETEHDITSITSAGGGPSRFSSE